MKLFNATKKIAAVGAASVIVANAAFAAGLNNYPNNFVEDGKFVGNVVVGSSATADAAAAEALIADLTADLGGDEKVKITYRKSSTSGKELPAVESNSDINFGEAVSDSLESELDDSDSKLLDENSLDKEDYTQKFMTANAGKFRRAYDSSISEDIETGVYFDEEDTFAKYVLEFDNQIDLTKDSDREKFVGEKLTILGKEFVVSSIKASELTLVGGSNKVSLGEGEKSTVTVEGKSYDVEVQSVSGDKVLLTVNGQSKSIDVTDSEEVAGVNVVVTEVVSSNRDSVKGYAEIVVGGQEIALVADGEVEVNEEEVSEIHKDYLVESKLTGKDSNHLNKIEITYRVNDDTLLKEGDSLTDVLFNAFSFNVESVENDGSDDKKTFTLTASSDSVSLDLVGESGKEFSLNDVIKVTEAAEGKAAETATIELVGDNEEDDDFLLTHDLVAPTNINSGIVQNGTDRYKVTVGEEVVSDLAVNDKFVIDGKYYVLTSVSLATGIKSYVLPFTKDSVGTRFIAGGSDDAVIYEISSYNKGDEEFKIKRLSEDGSDIVVDKEDFRNKLDMKESSVDVYSGGVVLLAESIKNKIKLDNNLVMDLTAVEDSEASTENTGSIAFSYDKDIKTDNDHENADGLGEKFSVDISLDEDEAQVEASIEDGVKGNWQASTFSATENRVAKSSDVRLATSKYGTTVKFDTDEKDEVVISVPEKQVKAEVSYSTGAVASSTSSAIVDAADVADKKAELEKEGYKIVGTEDVSAVEVEVTAPMTDAEVTEMSNLIVVGGPAVNAVARTLLGVEEYSMEAAGVVAGEAVAKYFADSNSVLVYGYEAADTAAIVEKLVAGEADFE